MSVALLQALPAYSEPSCASNFDYLDKLLEKVVRFEFKISVIEEKIQAFTETIENKITDFADKLKSNDEQNKLFITKHETTLSDMESSLATNIETSNQTVDGLRTNVNSEIQDMIEHAYRKIDEIKGNYKYGVIFLPPLYPI
jgi:gas vesicle protein